MSAVQLIGKKAVLSRFGKFGTESWALYQGKQFIVGGVGLESLEEWLDDFDQAGSTATYTLRVYDSDTAPTASTANTDYTACVTFKLVDMYEGYGIAGHSTKLMDRIAGLEKEIKDFKEGGDSDNTDLTEIFMGWLNDPIKLNQVAGAVRTIFGSGGTIQHTLPISSATPVQTVSGFNNSPAATTEDPVTRVAAALDELEKRDPKLVEHLEKLAKLAKNDPMIFQAVISKLDAL